MTFEEKIRVAKRVLKENEKITNVMHPISSDHNGHGGFRVEVAGGENYWVCIDQTWDFTGFILERLPEWEDLEGFLDYQQIPYEKHDGSGLNLPDWTTYYLPLRWLTSPSILPEKVSEYMKWKDENG